jgi:hypothetical protein
LPGNLLLNFMILGSATLLVVLAGRAGAVGHLAVGFLAAAAVLAAIILVRRLVVIPPAGVFPHIVWLGAVVAAEEAAKLGITGRLRRRRVSATARRPSSPPPGEGRTRLRAAGQRGWGFAAAEHLLYLSVLPGSFALRMVTAGALHIGTSVWYALPQRPNRSSATVSMTRYIAAVGLHMLYNLTLTTLDSIGPFW